MKRVKLPARGRSLPWAAVAGAFFCLYCSSAENLNAQTPSSPRYAWKPGETYAYSVKVDADLGEVVEELTGHVTCGEEPEPSLLDAARALLEARENQMVTQVEWDQLREAVERTSGPGERS